MKQSHPNCTNHRCQVCLEEHLALGRRLDELTGESNRVDHLGRFHLWLKKNGHDPETEHGWGTEAAFDDVLIGQYATEFKAGSWQRRNIQEDEK